MSDDRNNPLADQLADLDIEVSDKSPDDDDPPSGSSKPASPPQSPTSERESSLSDEELFRQAVDDIDDGEIPDGTDPGPASPTSQSASSTPAHQRQHKADDNPVKSDRELFEQAVDDIDPAKLYDAKFRGQSGTDRQLPDEPPDDPVATSPSSPSTTDDAPEMDEARARQQAQQLQDEALFQKMVGDVDPLEGRDKYHRSRNTAQSRPSKAVSKDKLSTPSLPQSGEGLNYIPPLADSQKSLLRRHREFEHHVPQLHLRGMTRRNALEQLREFIPDHHGTEARFVRIIPGRGLQSNTDPVLNPTVLQWLEGPGLEYIRGYAPERLQGGDYGSLIVELATNPDEPSNW